MAIRSIIKSIQGWMPPVHKEGFIFIIIFAFITFLLFQLWDGLGYFGVVATIWCAAFFRDPARFTPEGDNLIVSPADGIVSKIETAKFPSELGLDSEAEVTRVTIFLNIFNVHIQRSPIAGEISQVNYHPGKFLSADLDKASEENERNSIVINTKHKNQTIVCVQIAGLIARRIVCFIKEGAKLQGGERYGLIRFGSRVDIYLPKGVQPKVLEGQTMIGAETIIADLDDESSVLVDEVNNHDYDLSDYETIDGNDDQESIEDNSTLASDQSQEQADSQDIDSKIVDSQNKEDIESEIEQPEESEEPTSSDKKTDEK